MFTKQQQLIKTYRGRGLEHKFHHDAGHLAKQGYIVQSQSYGGVRRAGIGSMLTLGVFGGRKPKELTVVYTLKD